MTRYDIIKKLDKDFLILINMGLLPVHFLPWKTIYETYLEDIKTNKKTVTYLYLSDYYNLSESQIRNIVRFMKS
jgi:uncharacterized protein YneF (UPF0154 family)